MKRGLHPVRPVLWLIVTALGLAALGHFRFTATADRMKPDNNPDKFHLWTANTGYIYTFTYDPHAADAWLFEAVVPLNTNHP